jgi:histidinol dehydrogenase
MNESTMKIAIEKKVGELDAGDRAVLLERRPTDESRLRNAVRDLLDEVRRDGDAALVRMARDFDASSSLALEVPRSRWKEALKAMDPGVRAAMERAIRNIEAFHTAQIPPDVDHGT